MNYKSQTPTLALIMTTIRDELQRQEDFFGLVIVETDYKELIEILNGDNTDRYGVNLDYPPMDPTIYKTDFERNFKMAMDHIEFYEYIERQGRDMIHLKLELCHFLIKLKKVPMHY